MIAYVFIHPTQYNVSTYRWSQGVPNGCSQHKHTCDVFVGINSNGKDSNVLDFTLEGKAKGWVAIGFSKTPNMVWN